MTRIGARAAVLSELLTIAGLAASERRREVPNR